MKQKMKELYSCTISGMIFAKEETEKRIRENLRYFILLFALFTMAFYPIFRANIEYVDDAQRKFTGVVGYEYFSRFISSFLSKLINTHTYLADISPLPQLIAIAVLSISAICLLRVFWAKNEKIPFIAIIAVLSIGINPYFLECISYKFDAPYMAISILAGILPLAFRKKHPIFYIMSAILGVLVVCMTYQAASGIFPTLVALYAFYQWNDGEKLKKVMLFLSYSVIGYLAGLVIFRQFFMVWYDGYVSNRIFGILEMPRGIWTNLITFYTYLKNDFNMQWIVLIGLILTAFVVLSVVNSKQNKVLAFGVSLLLVIAIHVLSFGAYLVIARPLFEARAMYGYCVMIAGVAAVCTTYRFSWPAKFAAVCLSYCFLVFSFLYGNALSEQARFVEFRSQLVLNDINTLEIMQQEGTKQVQMVGSIGMSPVITNMPQYDGVLKRLVQTTLAGSAWTWDEYYFQHYYDLTDVEWVTGLKKEELPLIADHYYQRIYGEGNQILIELKER